MDIKQYGPALFPTLKQVRSRLFENGPLPVHTRSAAIPGDWATEPEEDRRAKSASSE